MIRGIFIAIFLFLAQGSNAAASYHPSINHDRLNGQEYLYLCDAGFEDQAFAIPFSDTVWRLYECARFVQKLRHKLQASSVHGYEVCIPHEIESAEIVYLGMLWLDDHPEEAEKTADEVVSAALFREWPCLANRRPPAGSN